MLLVTLHKYIYQYINIKFKMRKSNNFHKIKIEILNQEQDKILSKVAIKIN